MRKGLFVAAVTRERDDLRRNGDLVALESVGIAAAIPALVVPAADLVRRAHERVVVRDGHVLQKLVARGGVGLHDREFFARELAGLV